MDLASGLASGEYHVLAEYTDPSGAPQQLTSDFAATQHQDFGDRLKLFFDRHTLPIILAIALIAVGVLLFRLLRRQRRLETELRQVKAELHQDPPPS